MHNKTCLKIYNVKLFTILELIYLHRTYECLILICLMKDFLTNVIKNKTIRKLS